MQNALKVFGLASLFAQTEAQTSPPEAYQVTIQNKMPVVSTMF